MKIGIYLAPSLRSSHIREVYRTLLRYARLRGWEVESNRVAGCRPMGPLSQWRGDGLVVHSSGWKQPLEGLELPMVNLSSSSGSLGLPSVWVDDDAIVDLAHRHLEAKGVSGFAFFGHHRMSYSEARREALSKVVQRRGGELLCFNEAEDPFEDPGGDWEGAAARWLRHLPMGTGVLCCDDMRAQWLVQRSGVEGRSIPEDLRVVGVNDDEMICDLNRPSITSIAHSGQELAHRAAEVLEKLVKGETVGNTWVAPRGLVERESTRAFQHPLLQRAMTILIGGGGNASFKVQELLQRLPTSRRTLERVFIEELGRTPLQEIHRQRQHHLESLLQGTDWTCARIAKESGWSSPEKMDRFFRKMTGQTPTAFRRSLGMEGKERSSFP